MREIKFRVWDSEKNLMVYSDSVDSINAWKFANGMSGLDWGESIFIAFWKIAGIIGTDKMQFIGLQDRNGEDIYEGDIVNKIYGDDLIGIVMIGICDYMVQECSNYFCACESLLEYNGVYIEYDSKYHSSLNHRYLDNFVEVIGNIHQNPEILPLDKFKFIPRSIYIDD